jgi:hypothetical protein
MAGVDRAGFGAEASVEVVSLAGHVRHHEASWPEQLAGDGEKTTAMSVVGS